MLIPINVKETIELGSVDIEYKTFKSLSKKEADLEEFLRKNIEVIIDDETLLIIGRQVTTKENSRSDLTAIDENGNLVLVEIKRDIDDITHRKEPFEFQAIRYAASYAKIKSVEELVDKIFASYIEKYKSEFELGTLNAYEKAARILGDFLEKNNATKTFNNKQRIILIASDFDNQTLSAVAWLISNKVDISCFSLSPLQIGEGIFIDINRLLPPPMLEDFYVDIDRKKQSKLDVIGGPAPKNYLPRMQKLFEWGLLLTGATVVIKNNQDLEAVVIDANNVSHKGEILTFNQWGKKVTGWSAINVYEWTMIKGGTETLDQLRRERMKEDEEGR